MNLKIKSFRKDKTQMNYKNFLVKLVNKNNSKNGVEFTFFFDNHKMMILILRY